MRLLSPAKVCDRIAFETVGAALHQDELGFRRLQIRLNPFPGAMKVRVVSARRERNIEFRAAGFARTGFFRCARSRIQIAPVFVNVGQNKVRVVLKSVEHAVAMVGVDVNVCDAPESEILAQVLNGDTAVIEHTETGSMITRRVMQACNRHKCTRVVAVHDFIDGAQYGTDDSRCSVVNTRYNRCIAIIEPALAQG